MKSILTLSALALAGSLSLPAHAAIWTLGDSSVSGLRVGAVTFNGQSAGVELGDLSDDYYDMGLDYVAAGSWRDTTASLGGNSVDLHLSHEAYVYAAQPGDAATASVQLLTSAGLNNAQITAPAALSAVALAPASVQQDFIITPELGESLGMAVAVTFSPYYEHSAEASGFNPYLSSSYELYLNGDLLDYDSANGGGAGGLSWNFLAHIGDTLSLHMLNTVQVGVSGLAVDVGATPEAWAYGEAGASLSISPVPEPETWAMLVMGLGLVGLRMRGKAQSPTFKIGA